MAADETSQHVHVSDEARTGDITLIGKIAYHVKRPSIWEEVVWDFVSRRRAFIVTLAVLELILLAAYSRVKDAYLVPLWHWGWAAILLTAVAWGWYTWGRLERTRKRLALTLLASLALGAGIGWDSWQIAFPDKFDPDTFGIAVAEVGEGADFRRTGYSRVISGEVYTQICDTIDDLTKQPDGTTCAGTGSSSNEQQISVKRIGVVTNVQRAHAYGRRISADVVVWGRVHSSQQDRVTLRFHVIETSDRAVSPEVPAILPVTSTSAEIYIREANPSNDLDQLKKVVSYQATVISSFALGLAAYWDRDFPAAVRWLEMTVGGIEEPPTDVDEDLEIKPEGQALLHFYLGRAHQAVGRVQDGQKSLEQALKDNGEEPAVPLALALGYGALGNEEKRDTYLQSAFDLVNEWLKDNPDDLTARYDRGIIYEILGREQDRSDLEFAVDEFKAILKQDPTFYVAYLSMGRNLVELNDLQQAEETFTTALEQAKEVGIDPSWAHLDLAEVYAQMGEQAKARAEYSKAIKAAPETDWMYYYYAKFLEDHQEMDAALEAFRHMIKVTQKRGWAYGQLGDFFRRRGLTRQAIEHYRQAVREDPDNGLLHAYLGEMYFELGSVDKAKSAFDQALQHGEDVYYVHASYANHLFQLGEFQPAARRYERALELAPSDCGTRLNLGRTYLELDRATEAVAQYCQVVSLADQCTASLVEAAEKQLNALDHDCP